MTASEPGFLVVINDEEQYSIWPAGREHAPGWRAAGFAGSRQECLDHIERVWTDMRPRSVRAVHADRDSRG
jgi:MbtH protein